MENLVASVSESVADYAAAWEMTKYELMIFALYKFSKKEIKDGAD